MSRIDLLNSEYTDISQQFRVLKSEELKELDKEKERNGVKITIGTRISFALFQSSTASDYVAAQCLSLYMLIDATQPSLRDRSLFPHDHYWIASKRIVTPQGIISGAVEVNNGLIKSLIKEEDWQGRVRTEQVIDYGEAVVIPGLVDV
ncbi:hypothetical protein AgCh_020918 [Apium graveolens]